MLAFLLEFIKVQCPYFQVWWTKSKLRLSNFVRILYIKIITRRPASADRTARRQFQAVSPVITGSVPTEVIAHLHGLSMDLTVGRTIGPTVDSTVG